MPSSSENRVGPFPLPLGLVLKPVKLYRNNNEARTFESRFLLVAKQSIAYFCSERGAVDAKPLGLSLCSYWTFVGVRFHKSCASVAREPHFSLDRSQGQRLVRPPALARRQQLHSRHRRQRARNVAGGHFRSQAHRPRTRLGRISWPQHHACFPPRSALAAGLLRLSEAYRHLSHHRCET